MVNDDAVRRVQMDFVGSSRDVTGEFTFDMKMRSSGARMVRFGLTVDDARHLKEQLETFLAGQ